MWVSTGRQAAGAAKVPATRPPALGASTCGMPRTAERSKPSHARTIDPLACRCDINSLSGGSKATVSVSHGKTYSISFANQLNMQAVITVTVPGGGGPHEGRCMGFVLFPGLGSSCALDILPPVAVASLDPAVTPAPQA